MSSGRKTSAAAGTAPLLDHERDAGTGPDLAPEPVRLRPVPEELGDQALLSGREPGRAPGTWASAEGLRPAVAGASAPTADADGRDAKRLSDVTPRPARSPQLQCPKPPPFASIGREGITGLHAPILLGPKGNILCATVSRKSLPHRRPESGKAPNDS